MATYIAYSNTGFGLTKTFNGVTSSYRVNGHGFWPNINDQGFNFNSDYGSAVSLTPRTTFDLSGFRPGYEVVMYLVRIRTNTAPNSGTYTLEFTDSIGNIIFSSTYSFNHPATSINSYESWAYVFTGVRNGFTPEINSNGTYYFKTTGAVTETRSIQTVNYNTINNTSYYGHEGNIWVEGANIKFINRLGSLGIIQNDGGNYGFSGTTQSGNIWVPGGGSGFKYLCYVDASGIIRHTKNGTYYLDNNTSTTNNVGVVNAGAISVSETPNWTSIKFVAADGNLVRLGQGYLYGNMY